jgi:hypothetical protein
VALRVAAAELVLLVLVRFAFRRPAAAFFVVERLLLLRGFSVPPVTASAMLVSALDTPCMAASMLGLGSLSYCPQNGRAFSFFLLLHCSLLRCVYVSVTLSLGRGQSRTVRKLCRSNADVGKASSVVA